MDDDDRNEEDRVAWGIRLMLSADGRIFTEKQLCEVFVAVMHLYSLASKAYEEAGMKEVFDAARPTMDQGEFTERQLGELVAAVTHLYELAQEAFRQNPDLKGKFEYGRRKVVEELGLLEMFGMVDPDMFTQ